MNTITNFVENVWLKIKKSNPYKIKKIYKVETDQNKVDNFEKKFDKKA